RASLVQSVTDFFDDFYPAVIKPLKPWAAKAPVLREPNDLEREPVKPQSLVSTSLSSQDGPMSEGAYTTATAASDVVPALAVQLDEPADFVLSDEPKGRVFALRRLGRK